MANQEERDTQKGLIMQCSIGHGKIFEFHYKRNGKPLNVYFGFFFNSMGFDKCLISFIHHYTVI